MKLLFFFFIIFPVFCFSQNTSTSIAGTWVGYHITTSVTFPDGKKIKDTLTVHYTTKSIFVFKKNNTGSLSYISKDDYNSKPLIFNYRLLNDSVIWFKYNNGDTYNTKYLNEKNVLFFIPSRKIARQESIELFYEIKYRKI